MRDGSPPYEAIIATVCEAFQTTPDVAQQQDEFLTAKVMEAMSARQTVRDYKAERKLTEGQQKMYTSLLDELDKHDEEHGMPEE